VDLPLLTRILIVISNSIRNYILIIIIAIIAGVLLLRSYIATKVGRKNYERFLFSLPIFGEFFHLFVVERFTAEMATLVESGVPILYSLDIAEHGVNNLILGEIILKIKDDVRDGKPLSLPLQKSGFFEPMVVQMVTIGEEIGDLSNMFKRLNLYYQEYVDTYLTRFTTLFEPIMLIFMGIVIGIIVVGMFMPIFKIAQLGSS